MATQIATHRIVSHEDWLKSRKALLERHLPAMPG